MYTCALRVEHVSSRMSLGATIVTIVETDPYLTYLDDQWTPTANSLRHELARKTDASNLTLSIKPINWCRIIAGNLTGALVNQ